MSWSALVSRSEPPPPDRKQEKDADDVKEHKACILDANALISGGALNLLRFAERFYTIQEVFDEIRDKQSRQYLQSLPFTVEVKDYTEDSLKAVTRFARETGDIHALSAADLKLLALCHTMEVAAHGGSHLREHPMQAAMRSKHRSKGRAMPGWGNVANPEEWKVVDEAAHDTNGPQGESRIRADVQSLEQDHASILGQEGSQDQGQGGPPNTTAAVNAAAATQPFRTFGEAAAAAAAAAASSAAAATQQQQKGLVGDVAAQVMSGLRLSEGERQGDSHGLGALGLEAGGLGSMTGSLADSGDDGDEWATAGKSKNAVRRKNRRHKQYLAREEARAQARALEQEHQQQKQQRKQAAQQQEQQQQQQQQHPAEDGQPHSQQQGAGSESGSCSLSSDNGESEGEAGSASCSNGTAGGGEGSSPFNLTSNVLCVTADFAMQNVLLQMGLRLMAQDGRQITRVSRWALRCVACFFVTKEAGRLFCPRCGNAALERVEVMVSPEGTEFFGVKKKHILRGTRYSLPKPKGGRASNPVLREDQMLKKVRRRNKQAEAAIDPFAPEFGNDTWHVGGKTQAGMDPSKGAAFLLAGWKHNPNERRSNRNRK